MTVDANPSTDTEIQFERDPYVLRHIHDWLVVPREATVCTVVPSFEPSLFLEASTF